MGRTEECMNALGELQEQISRIDFEMERSWDLLDRACLRQAFQLVAELAGMLEHAADLARRVGGLAEARIAEGEAGRIPGILAERSAECLRLLRSRQGRVMQILDRAMMRRDGYGGFGIAGEGSLGGGASGGEDGPVRGL